jgi:hypothetical protein
VAALQQGERGGPVHTIERAWRSIRKRAGLEDVRLHDLRHSAASDMLAAGLSLPIIGHVLGHEITQTMLTSPIGLATRPRGSWASRSSGALGGRGAAAAGTGAGEAPTGCGGGGHGEAAEGTGMPVNPLSGAKVIRFPGKRRG